MIYFRWVEGICTIDGFLSIVKTHRDAHYACKAYDADLAWTHYIDTLSRDRPWNGSVGWFVVKATARNDT